MIKILQKLIRVHTIVLCGLLFPLSVLGQQESDSDRHYSLQEVAIIQSKTDALQLLRKLVSEKQRQFRDTQIAYVLIRENAPPSQTDTMPDGLLLNFRNGEVREVATFPYTSSSREGYSGWKFSAFSAFGRYILFEKSLESLFLSNAPQEGITASLQESTKSFYIRGTIGRVKYSILYIYQFKDTGTTEMISYYDALRGTQVSKRVIQYSTASIFPTKVTYNIKGEPDVQYIFQSVALNLEEKTLTSFNKFKVIEALLKK